MSQLPDQLLKSANIPIMMPPALGINMMNQVPIPQQLQNQSNLPLNPNMPIGADHKSQPNQDTSNFFLNNLFLILFFL